MSPTGALIAFDSDRDGLRGVYVAAADGTNARRISGDGYASVPSWSPDGQHVAFVKAEPRRASVWNVWLATPDGQTLRRVTSHELGQPWGASWFPDGRRLAYSREEQLVISTSRRSSTIITSPRRGHLCARRRLARRLARGVPGTPRRCMDARGASMMLRRILPDPSAEEFVWSHGRTHRVSRAQPGGMGGLDDWDRGEG